MTPVAMPPMTDDELLVAVARLIALLEGLPTTPHKCGTCGRVFQLSKAHELNATADDIRRELFRRGVEVPKGEVFSTRWQAMRAELKQG